MSPSHEAILPNVPPENVEAMARAAVLAADLTLVPRSTRLPGCRALGLYCKFPHPRLQCRLKGVLP